MVQSASKQGAEPMQKIFIKNTTAAPHYALFLSRKGAIVNYLTCFENKAVLEVDMRQCKTPVSHEVKKENDAGRWAPRVVRRVSIVKHLFFSDR